jgi:hypothetical protein
VNTNSSDWDEMNKRFASARRFRNYALAYWLLGKMRAANERLEDEIVAGAAPRGLQEFERFLSDVTDGGYNGA